VLRAVERDDVDDLWRRRNEPEVAQYQSWRVPYPFERARAMVDALAVADEPPTGDWWMTTVCLAATGEIVGDLALCLTWEGRSAEIGYTLATDHWGRGYAVEAVEAFVAWLFTERGVRRVWAMTHPDNVASAMVLERVGMVYEGRTRSSYWVGPECSDDVLYGMTRDDWEQWRTRPTVAPGVVSLAPITADNHRTVGQLATHKSQERFVAPMSRSFGDALFPDVVNGEALAPWLRAVVADDVIAGFVMLALRTPQHPEPYLWRLLIDRRFQRRGIGSRVLDLVAETCRQKGDGTLLASWTPGKGSPSGFYLARGFEPTGRITEGEIEGRLRLD
jgi:RimJ/RimL family protein N-acetyltransferase